MTSPRVLLSWSSGKDSAWALHVLRQQTDLEVVGLLTTFNEAFDRVAMHAVRRELVEAQAAAAGLPLIPVMLPYPCTNEVYEERMKVAIADAKAGGVTHIAFGDLFLADIREYRVRLFEGTGIEPLFPIWTTAEETPDLARRMLDAGLRAVLTCVDPKQLDKRFVGRQYDEQFLADLSTGVDPCGERGEFHTFCYRCPQFSSDIPVTVGDVVERDGFWFADLQVYEHGRTSISLKGIPTLRERLAALEHKQWAHWTRYLLDHVTPENTELWRRQIDTPYEHLSESEKDSDREWADQVLRIVQAAASPPQP